MDQFLDALNALHAVLAHSGETEWRDRIALDIDAWETTGSAEPHRAAYRQRESLADVVVYRPGKTMFESALVGALFEDVRSVCFQLANGAEIARLTPMGLQVHGWECSRCGYAEVHPDAVDATLAQHVARQAVERGLAKTRLLTEVKALLAGRLPALDDGRARLQAQVEPRGVRLRKRHGPMQPCPNCGAAETRQQRWSVSLAA